MEDLELADDGKLYLKHNHCVNAVRAMREHFARLRPAASFVQVYGVPRGGIPVAYLFKGFDESHTRIVDRPHEASVIVDDLVDSGATMKRHCKSYPDTLFLTLWDFVPNRPPGKYWVVFPWEVGERDTSGDDIVIRLLEYIGENPKRGGLLETPDRVLKAWKEWTSGYDQDPKAVLKCFEDGGENYNEMVVVKNLPFFSHCEHHLTPFFGTATIAYVPDKRVVGLSKVGRILNIFAKRLQVQERLTTQIADTLQEHLKPLGVGVLLKARHLCMESRGLATQGHHTVTSALRGVFLEEKARAEFLSIAQRE